VSDISARSSSTEQVYPSRNASVSAWGEATFLIAQHFGSILLSLCHTGGVERGPMAQVPTLSSGQRTRVLTLKPACRSVVTTWVTHSRRLHSATSVLLNETGLGNISGDQTQSSVPDLGMAQLTLS